MSVVCAVPGAVSAGPASRAERDGRAANRFDEVDNSKLVPVLWCAPMDVEGLRKISELLCLCRNAVRELAAEGAELRGALKAMQARLDAAGL